MFTDILFVRAQQLETTHIYIHRRMGKQTTYLKILSWVKEATHKGKMCCVLQFIWSLKTVQQLLIVVKKWKQGSYSLWRCIKGPSSVMEMFSVFIWVVIMWVEITCVVVIAFVEIHQTVHLRTDHHFYVNCTSAKNKECQVNQKTKKSFETASPYFPNWV